MWKFMDSQGAFTRDANDANKLRYSREVGRLNILSLFASFAREIHYTTDANTCHGRGFCRQLQSRCKMYSCFCKSTKMYIYSSGYPHTTTITLSSIVVWDFLPLLVMTSLLEQAPDWLTQREYPPNIRFFNLRGSREWRVKCSIRTIRAASFTWIAPQDCLSCLCIDWTCKSFASFASGVNAP